MCTYWGKIYAFFLKKQLIKINVAIKYSVLYIFFLKKSQVSEKQPRAAMCGDIFLKKYLEIDSFS